MGSRSLGIGITSFRWDFTTGWEEGQEKGAENAKNEKNKKA
jgi:hypothetical protein